MGGAVDHRHHGTVLAGDVDEAVRPELQRMRRDARPQIDVADMSSLVEVDDAQEMAWIGIAAVDPVAEDRHVGEAGFRHHQQFVHRAWKIVEHDFRLVAGGIEEQDFRPHLVDRDHSACVACVRHRSGASLLACIAGANSSACLGQSPCGHGGRRADRSRATASLATTVAAANRLALIEMSEAVRAGIGALARVLGGALGIA